MNTATQREPLLTVGTITAIIAAALIFLKSMGVNITDDQQESIRNLVAVLAPIVLAFVARQFVYSPVTTDRLATEAYEAGTPPTRPKPDLPGPPATE